MKEKVERGRERERSESERGVERERDKPVEAWTVVMRPSAIPNSSWTTCTRIIFQSSRLTLLTQMQSTWGHALARGARQLVVQLALDMTSMVGSYALSFTPITNIGASAEGAEITTFFAPPWRERGAEIESQNQANQKGENHGVD